MKPVKGPKIAPERRVELAAAFLSGGELYDRVRPSYPVHSASWLIPEHAMEVIDLGAGTGKFTERLVAHGLSVTAVDPSADMLQQLSNRLSMVRTVVGTAEQFPLPSSSTDAVFVAQAWHWFDASAASAEIARVLRPGGRLGLLWNQLDVRIPWVHRLSRIMHAGDVHRPEARPAIGPQFGPATAHLSHWAQELTTEDLIELVKSRSYYLRASEQSRSRVLNNLDWYLFEHLNYRRGQLIELPYLTLAWRADKLA
ncbi:class I SAM-dependent methyltransferase [Psychromicrobium lacuslunae]|uniref:Ubiquinone biosynthesis protein n=1 Tax=Psychromicrobium lacuslunae TaxID=1618207 RepID=A0A0D4BY43_9MICC|nr:class I SAM-dependent methyltransferase [Psychromicrobium lacuslunae]AJT41387.1 ubiquinone biosynthesis protein [Psychromicrobium lacuslunae]